VITGAKAASGTAIGGMTSVFANWPTQPTDGQERNYRSEFEELRAQQF